MKDIKVLYVDDEYINLQLFALNFENSFSVFTADNPLKGLEIIDGEPELKVVISDMKMPKMNGIEFIKIAKAKRPDINFHILTGFSLTEEIQTALDNGLILSYMKKPFNINEISTEICKAIRD